MGKFGMLGTIT